MRHPPSLTGHCGRPVTKPDFSHNLGGPAARWTRGAHPRPDASTTA